MGIRINNNSASLQAQNALNRSTEKLNTALTRLSTGLRINTSKDDSVGLAKSESLRTTIRSLDKAQENITNAQSFLGTADSYLAQLTEIAQKMSETAVQSADATLSGNDRQVLATKFASYSAEFTRLSNSASFAGTNLLDGSFTNKTIQIGDKEGQQYSFSIDDARAVTVGQVAIYTVAARSSSPTAIASNIDFSYDGGIQVVGFTTQTVGTLTGDSVSTRQSSESSIAYAAAINAVSGQTGVTATVLANVQTFNYSSGATNTTISSVTYIAINGVTVHLAGQAGLSLSMGTDEDAAVFINEVNAKAGLTGVTASLDTINDDIVFTASDGRNIEFTQGGGTSSISFIGVSSTATSNLYRGAFKLTSDNGFSVTGASMEFVIAGNANANVDSTTALQYANVNSAANAGFAISIMDNVVRQLQKRRSTIGSVQERMDIASAEMSSRKENIVAAESSIRDADIAAETARLTQAQILQQAGVTVLGQANSAPQIALSLLQNI